MREWYAIDNIEEIDTPALVVYPDRVKENIRVLKNFVPDTSRLRPHAKTNKSQECSRLIIDAGITKFKCATISEAEMLAMAGAKDVLLAYQPVGPKAMRLLALKEKYPATQFSCLIDNLETAGRLSSIFLKVNQRIPVYIDLNVGMDRTGISPENAYPLYLGCQDLKGIAVTGLHAYDGHIRETNFELRSKHADESFARIDVLKNKSLKTHSGPLTVVAGGTPTFPIHSKRRDIECSPGTFIYWDMGYQRLLPEQPFVFAALVITRVISKPAVDTLCIDLGHKSIASENPIDSRVFFLDAPGLQPVGHSEEHMIVRAPAANSYKVGDVLFGVPFHICPTCALYDSAWIAENYNVGQKWAISSRNRTITI